MKLMSHIIAVQIDDNRRLLINSLTGLIDQVSAEVYKVIEQWRGIEKIVPMGDFEAALYENLKERGYLVCCCEKETSIKNRIIKKLSDVNDKTNKAYKGITFVLTYNCNFRCHYCFEGEHRLKKEIMTQAQIDAALELAGDDLEYVGLFGGEPLLPETRPIMEYLVSKTSDKIYSMFTNGYYLSEYFDLLSQIKISDITVTLDGDEEAHNKRRHLADGSPTYKKIMHGVEMYLSNGIPICIRMNTGKGNFEASEQLRETLIDNFGKYGDLLAIEIVPMLEDSVAERTELLTKLYSADSELSVEERQQRNRMFGKDYSVIDVITVDAKRLAPIYSYCRAHHGNICLVDPYGHIYACAVSVGIEELAVGTYYPQVSYKENSIFTRNIETIPQCRECIYSLLCGGGCVMSMSSYDDVNKPACSSVHYALHSLLPNLYRASPRAK